MERGNWKRPVFLEIFGRPGVTIVRDTLEAAMVLLGAWPHQRTAAHMAAVTSCRDVLAGRAEPALSRVEFIEAALDAGFRVQPETFIEEVQLPFDGKTTGEHGEGTEERRLPSILSFARRALSSTPASSRTAPADLAVTATESTPKRWPPPVWASIEPDREIPEQSLAGTVHKTEAVQFSVEHAPETVEKIAEAESEILVLRRSSPLPVYDFDDGRDGHAEGETMTSTPQTMAPPLPRDRQPASGHSADSEMPLPHRVVWDAIALQPVHPADSPRLGELFSRLFETLAMIGLVTVKTVAGVVHLDVQIPDRSRSHGPAGSH